MKSTPANQTKDQIRGKADFERLQQHLGLPSSSSSNSTPPSAHPIILSLDLECYEHNPSLVTEIGISTLDTHRLFSSPRSSTSGTNGCNWHELIDAHHIRIEEYSTLINRAFISGCPEAFQHGRSEILPLETLRARLEQLFTHRDENGNRRDVVLLGHDLSSDVNHFKKLNVGFDLERDGRVVPEDGIDTANVDVWLTGGMQKRKLARVVEDLGWDAWFLHNAGNDAWFALVCGIGMVVRKYREGHSDIDGGIIKEDGVKMKSGEECEVVNGGEGNMEKETIEEKEEDDPWAKFEREQEDEQSRQRIERKKVMELEEDELIIDL